MRTACSHRIGKVPAFCLCALLLAGMAPAADPDVPAELTLTAGKSTIVKCDLPIERIVVGFGDIAEASAASPYEVLVNGKTPGITSLIIWQRDGTKRFFDVRVNASTFAADSRVDAIRRELALELPGQKITLSLENDTAFLRGSVKDVTTADRAVAIASTLGKTVNLLYVDVPEPEAQILLRVKFASVDRSANTQLGMNLLSTGAANTIGSVSTGQFSAPAAPVVTPGTQVASTITDALNLFFFRPDLNLGATIEALQTKGLLQILSEPNVLAENGKQSSFLAGGEFPFPSVSGGGVGGTPAVSIQFREYGVRLTFTPTITPRGTIQLQVAPEVSALDFTNGLLVSGFNVPALTTRKMSTQVELSEGQSFAIGGLLDNRTTDTLEKIPFIGDIPILGKFFQSKSTTKQNTELIVIVTPELVRPIPAGQPLPALKFTVPFLPPNTGYEPRTPGLDATGPVPVDPPQPTIPIEKLMKSMRQAELPVPPIGGLATSSAGTASGSAH
jgi:pilus assembly protein CpaC